MLELRPNCELCDKDLPTDAVDARICTYECTFCADCVDHVLSNVCPNCGGGFASRPLRPQTAYRSGVSLQHQPASLKRVNTSYNAEQINKFCETIKNLPPVNR